MNEDQWNEDQIMENEPPAKDAVSEADLRDDMEISENTGISEGMGVSGNTGVSENTEVLDEVRTTSNGVTDLYTSPDVYETSSSSDIYTVPVTEIAGAGGVFSSQRNISQSQSYGPQGNAYQNQAYNPGAGYYQNQAYNPQGDIYQNQAYNPQGNVYQNQPYGSRDNTYQSQTYNPQGNVYQNQPYGSQGNGYQEQSYGSQGNAYQSQSYDPQGNVNQNQPYGSQGNAYQNPYYGAQNGYNNPYSPYAVPRQHKKHTGLIIGVVIGIIILFLIAIFAVLYYALQQIAENRRRDYSYENNRYYDYFDDDDYDYNRDHDQDDYHDHDSWRKNDSEYYELEDDIRYDLSYSVSWEYYEYEPEDDEDVSIMVTYPIIKGDSIPNLDRINDLIHEEVEVITEYYEDYSGYLTQDSYFSAYSSGYVTYMDEDVLSVVFAEEIYSDFYGYANLYSINVDMRNGVVIENTDLLDIDDDFSVDFRQRSEEQNGYISGLDYMSDQEITYYLTDSDSLIIFYTPLGMEIGLNYSDGWVTVTYKDFEDYLKIF